MEFPPEVVDLEDIDPNPNILIFSKPKAGKTVWACSDDKVFLINCEVNGEVSANSDRVPEEFKSKSRKQWKVRKYEDFEACLEWLKSLADAGPMPFNWVVLDTITTLQDRQMMRYCLDKMLKKKPDRNKYVPDKPEYLETQQMIVQKVKELCDLPVGVIITAHLMEQEDPEGNSFYYPKIQGGKFVTAQAILSFVTSYGYMYVKTRKKDGKPVIQNGEAVKDRYIMWEDNDKMQGGDRTGVFGQFTKNVPLRELRLRLEAKAQRLQDNSKG
jgi:hypothetical protein